MIRYLLPLLLLLHTGAVGQPGPVDKPRSARYFSHERNRPPDAENSVESANDFRTYYTTWAVLAQRSRQAETPITLVLTIDSTSQKNDWASLRAVQHVQSLQLNLNVSLTQNLADSLLRAWANWPGLARISVYVATPRLSQGLPVSVVDGRGSDQLKSVQSLSVSGERPVAALQLVAFCPSVKSLSVSSYGGKACPLPTVLSQMNQLESLTLYGKFIGTDLEKVMPALTNLRSIDLSEVGETGQLANSLKQMPRLRKMSLTTYQPQSFTGLRLGDLPQLDTLRLSFGPKSAVSLDSVLAGTTSLKVVDVYGDVWSSLDWMADNPGLRRVNLARCRLRPTRKSLANLTRLAVLALTPSDSLRQFPEQLTTLPNLRELRIDGAGITEVPPSIGSMTSLTMLSLSDNKIAVLPAEIGQLTDLKTLYVYSNRLETLPASLARLVNLTDLGLNSNKLTSLPAGLGSLRQLQSLVLSNNKLTRLPDDIARCTALLTLALANNPLTYLPEDIGELNALDRLDLNRTLLGRLPESMGKLTQLKQLSLSGGHLSALPESMGNWVELTGLFLSDSILSVIPTSLFRLKKLESLTLNLPQPRFLPPALTDLTRLRTLNIVMPQLLVLPDELGKLAELTWLSITSNKLIGLPNSLGRLSRLEQLTLDGGVELITNQSLGGLQQLPDSIARCQKLSRLSIRNQLAFEGADAIRKVGSLTAVTYLSLDHCGIDRLVDIDWRLVQLRHLSLQRNSLRDIPEAVLEAPRLEQLYLDYNYPLPRALNRGFWNKESLRTAFVEASLNSGALPTDKPNARIMQAYMNAARRQAQTRNWGEVFANFEKAVLVAPDTLKSLPLAERAELYMFRKEFALAVADLEKAILFSPKLAIGTGVVDMAMRMGPNPLVTQWWGRLGTARLELGQYEKALVDIDKALGLFPKEENSAMKATFYIQRGKINANLQRPAEAKESLTKARDEYAALERAGPGERLTEVELAILTNQPDKATAALTQYRKQYAREGVMGMGGSGGMGGYTTLQEYLTTCTAVLSGSQTPEKAIASLTTYLKTSPERIYSWSFDLFETMLPRIGLPADKVTALSTLTKITKEQAVKVE